MALTRTPFGRALGRGFARAQCQPALRCCRSRVEAQMHRAAGDRYNPLPFSIMSSATILASMGSSIRFHDLVKRFVRDVHDRAAKGVNASIGDKDVYGSES